MDNFSIQGLNEQADELIDDLRSVKRPRLYVISGPSGVGKDSVIEEMRAQLPDLHYAVTATTRIRRPGEIAGVHYHFLSTEEFERQVEDAEFLEHATVYGHLYGVPKNRVRTSLQSGRSVVLKVDVQGARSIRELVPQAILIFICPPDMAELLHRLQGRKSDDFDEIMKRLGTATHELTAAQDFDYVVFNDVNATDQAVKTISLIIEAEGHRINQPEITL